MRKVHTVVMALCIGLSGIAVQAAAPEGCVDVKQTLHEPTAAEAASYDYNSYIDANRILMMVYNDGNIAYDNTNVFGKTDGLYFPYSGFSEFPGSQTLVFAAGLWLAGKVNGELRMAQAEYSSQFRPGPMKDGSFSTDRPSYRVFKITESSNSSDPDYSGWPAADGAPTYQSGSPMLLGDQTLWTVYNDADPAMRSIESMSTEPLGIEVQQTVWASDNTAEETVVYLKYKLYNRGGNQIDSFYVSFWVDPDLGDASDDLVGCDSVANIFFCYNDGYDDQYGDGAPAWGGIVESGPVVPSVGDIASFDGSTLYDYRNVGMSSFSPYIIGTDPQSPSEVYSCMKGFTKDGEPYFDPDSWEVTNFPFSGDPELGVGWLDSHAFDRRLMINFGPFSFAPGDSQQVILKLGADLGTDELNSVTKLKNTLLYGSTYSLLPDIVSSSTVDLEVTDYGRLQTVIFCPPSDRWMSFSRYGNSDPFYVSSLKYGSNPELFHPVEMRFSPTSTQKAYSYVIDEIGTYSYAGYYDVPFTVWDVEENRQLNVAFTETIGSTDYDAAWNPPGYGDDYESSEYVFIFNSNYSGSDPSNNSIGYENLDLVEDGEQIDILYYIWPTVRSGYEFSELSDGQRLLFKPQKSNQNGPISQIDLESLSNYGSTYQKVYVTCGTSQMSFLRLVLSDTTSFFVSPKGLSFTSTDGFDDFRVYFDPPDGESHSAILYLKDVVSGATKAQLQLNGSLGSTSAPTLDDIPDQLLAAGESFDNIYFPAYVQDDDNSEDELTFSVYPLCNNFQIDLSASQVVTIQPKDASQPRADVVRFMVTDPDGWYAVDTVLLQSSSSSHEIAQTSARQYRMISLPLEPANSSWSAVLDELTGQRGQDWKFLRWDPLRVSYENNPTTLTPGLAYWIITAESQRLKMSGAAVLPSSSSDVYYGLPYYQVPISPGWNQIGVPCSYPLDFSRSRLRRADEYFGLQDPLCLVWPVIYHYNGNGYDVQVCYDSLADSPVPMESGDGYWVFVEDPCDDCELFLYAEESTEQSSAAKGIADEHPGEWTVKVSAECAGYEDNYNLLGIRSLASNAKDRFDLPEPPTISNYVSVVFDSVYTTDYRPYVEVGTTWHLSVRTNVDDVVNLTFNYNVVSEGRLNLLLTDLHSTQEMTITDGTTYRYDSRGQSRDFEITVVGKDYQPSDRPPLPEDFQLHANYPNPFNAETVISFEIPQTADVTLTISNALGQQVRVIEMPILARGTHEFTWDGSDGDGNPVASGVYFYTLSAGDFTASRKMVLLK